MNNSRKMVVSLALFAAILSAMLCACGPVEDTANSVNTDSSQTSTEAVSDIDDSLPLPDSTGESSEPDESSQAEIIHDPELICDLDEIPYTAKCTVQGSFGADAKLTDYYGINAMINSDQPLLSIPVKYTDPDFGGGTITFDYSDKMTDEQKADAVIMYFDEDSTFTKLESFKSDNSISANITTEGVYMVIDGYVYDMFNGEVSDERRYDVGTRTIELPEFSTDINILDIGDLTAAKVEKQEVTIDDFDGRSGVKIIYANLLDGDVDGKYEGVELTLSYFQRLDSTTVDEMLDMYAKSADVNTTGDDNIWLDYRGLDLGDGKRGCVIAALNEGESVNVQGIYQLSDSEYIQYNVILPLKYISMVEASLNSAMTFSFNK